MTWVSHKNAHFLKKTLDFTGQVCYNYYVDGEIGSSLTNNEACERARRKEDGE